MPSPIDSTTTPPPKAKPPAPTATAFDEIVCDDTAFTATEPSAETVAAPM